jgi:hypothetical protein
MAGRVGKSSGPLGIGRRPGQLRRVTGLCTDVG